MAEMDYYPKLKVKNVQRWTGLVPGVGQMAYFQPVVYHAEEGPVLCFSQAENFCPTCPLLSDCPRPSGTTKRLHDRPIPAEKIKLSIVE